MVSKESDSLRGLISFDFFNTIFTSSGNSTKEFPKTFFSFSDSCVLIMLGPSSYIFSSSRSLKFSILSSYTFTQ